jgi:hypothetical protein
MGVGDLVEAPKEKLMSSSARINLFVLSIFSFEVKKLYL